MAERLNDDQEVIREGRKNTFEDVPGVRVDLRQQISTSLMKRLKTRGVAEKVRNLWHQGNTRRAPWLQRQRDMLREYDEFFDEIYEAPTDWSSTLHLPTVLTHVKTFHARMFQALLGIDPPFAIRARSSANVDRVDMIENFMRWTLTDWANEHQGIHEAADGWLWDWVTTGVGILKVRWNKKYTRYEDVVEVPVEYTQPNVDGEGNTIAQLIQTTEEQVEIKVDEIFNGPSVELVRPEDLIIVGGGGDPQKAEAVMQASMLTASDLNMMADQGIFDKKAVTNVIESGGDYGDPTTQDIKDERESNAGLSDEDHYKAKQYEVIEAYLKMDVDGSGIDSDIVVFVHRQSGEILRATYLYRINKTGKRPFFKIDFHKRHGQPYGVGLVELLYQVGKEIDAIHNIRMDTGLITSLPWGFYRPGAGMQTSSIPIEPGSMIPLENPSTDVSFPNLGNRTGFAFQEESALNNVIERLTSINDMSFGSMQSQGAARTATGARILAGETNANLDIFLQRLNRGWKQVLVYIFQLLQENTPDGMEFRVTGDDGNHYYQQVKNRQELQGMYDFELEPNSANSNKSIQTQVASQVYQMTQNVLDIQLGLITPSERFEAIKNMYQVMGIKDISKYLRKPANANRLFTPEEVANRVLSGQEFRFTPDQDLQGFIAYVEEIFADDRLLGQFDESKAIALEMKKREAIQMLQAMEQMAAQNRNSQQVQMNTGLTTAPSQQLPLVPEV